MNITDFMRAAGVTRMRFTTPVTVDVPSEFGGGVLQLDEIELSDTIPAPPSFETLPEEPPKPPGTCIALGCMEPGGWHFDRRYCGPHGRSAAGVKP